MYPTLSADFALTVLRPHQRLSITIVNYTYLHTSVLGSLLVRLLPLWAIIKKVICFHLKCFLLCLCICTYMYVYVCLCIYVFMCYIQTLYHFNLRYTLGISCWTVSNLNILYDFWFLELAAVHGQTCALLFFISDCCPYRFAGNCAYTTSPRSFEEHIVAISASAFWNILVRLLVFENLVPGMLLAWHLIRIWLCLASAWPICLGIVRARAVIVFVVWGADCAMPFLDLGFCTKSCANPQQKNKKFST